MSGLKFSIVIPYEQRPEIIRLVFAGLADQTFDHTRFEVVVGALDHAPELTAACEEFAGRLDIVTVMADEGWNPGRARTMALRSATGQVLITVGGGTLLPARFLENLSERYFRYGQNIGVVGRVIDDGDDGTDAAEVHDYAHYRALLADLEAGRHGGWDAESLAAFARAPWVPAAGAPVAVPAAAVRQHGLSFDDGDGFDGGFDGGDGFDGGFDGGAQWARRICSTGTPLVPGEEVYALRLPARRAQPVTAA